MAAQTSIRDRPGPIRLGLVGVGKIARDRHLPAIAGNHHFLLAAAASRVGRVEQVLNFEDIDSMLRGAPGVQAVSLCVPPRVRARMARAALAAGVHVMLEKPPGMTVSEVAELESMAARCGGTLFTAWHSREASAVGHARDWLASRRVTAVRIRWLEDVRVWHPGQRWIWQEGGFGVFDPGINALSILTRILRGSLVMRGAHLEFPADGETPVRAQLALSLDGEDLIRAQFDFDHRGPPCWDIEVDTESGALRLSDGGERLSIDGTAIPVPPGDEYSRLYARFATLILEQRSDVDVSPLQLVADAFLCARRTQVAALEEGGT